MALSALAAAPRDRKSMERAIGALAARFGNRLVTSTAVREQHGHTLTWIANQPPDAVVLPNGELMTTSRRARKSAAGYDLTRLIVGSEGTLGVITELTLKLHGIPEAIASGVCPFPSVEAACNATILTIQSGIPIARIELLDALQVKACSLYSKLALPETPMLFVEFHGTDVGVAEQSQRFGEIAEDLGGGPFDWETRTEDRTRLWQARH